MISLKAPTRKVGLDIIGAPLTRFQLNPKPNGYSKVCYICKEDKLLTMFNGSSSRKDGKQTYCKECGKERQSKWYYQRKHGISLEERDEMLKKKTKQ